MAGEGDERQDNMSIESDSAEVAQEGGSSRGEEDIGEGPSDSRSESVDVDPSSHTPSSSSILNTTSEPNQKEEARQRIESTSAERISSLKAARNAASSNSPVTFNSTSPSTISSTSTPTPPSTQPISSNQSITPRDLPPPVPHFDPSILSQYANSRQGLISGLKRLTYILSLLLGSSAIIGLFWSAFILPLLHSTFSARQVILEQQKPRFEKLLNGLKELRSTRLYPVSPAVVKEGGDDGRDDSEDTEGAVRLLDHKSGIEEIRSNASSSTSKRLKKDSNLDTLQNPPHTLLPLDNLSTLTTSLTSLTDAISSTSTTRTSLLSTLEGYTAQLHREIYLRNDHHSSFSVGLGSLSQNLASASGGRVGKGDTDEWDDVRKEIRAIKGLLLGRRSLVH